MIAAALLLGTASPDPIAGSWEGTSLCEVKTSPCRDEHVIYHFSSNRARSYRIDAFKLIAGKAVFMGPIDVILDPSSGQLEGPVVSAGRSLATLHLTVSGAHLSGSMTLADGTLYRRIEADKR